MAKKRKPEASGLDEVERTLFSSFRTAAKSISQLYTQAQQHHQVAFHEGERHFAEKLCQWLKDQQRTSIVVEDILQFLQDEIDSTSGDDRMVSPTHQSQPSFTHAAQLQQQPLLSGHQGVSAILGLNGLENACNVSKAAATVAEQSKAYALGSSGLVSASGRCLSPSGFPQNDSTGTIQSRRLLSMFEGQTQQGGNLDCSVDRYSTGWQIPHTGSNVFVCDPRLFEHRPAHTVGEDDMNMDMHADGNVEAPFE